MDRAVGFPSEDFNEMGGDAVKREDFGGGGEFDGGLGHAEDRAGGRARANCSSTGCTTTMGAEKVVGRAVRTLARAAGPPAEAPMVTRAAGCWTSDAGGWITAAVWGPRPMPPVRRRMVSILERRAFV